MADNIYRKTEVVGTSAESVDEAIRGAVRRASESLRQVSWFEVKEIRGHVENGEVGHFPVPLKLGSPLAETTPCWGVVVPAGQPAPPARPTPKSLGKLTSMACDGELR